MSPNLKLATLTKAPVGRSVERQALAAAIAKASEAERAAERGRASVARAADLIAELENKLASAVAAVADAREQHGLRVAEAVAAGQASPASALRAARAVETDAADDLEAAKAALVKLTAAVADLEEDAGGAGLAVDRAVNVLLAAAAVPLVDELEQVKSKIPGLQAVLHFIKSRAGIRRGNYLEEISELARPLADVAPRISQAIEVGLNFNLMAAEQNPAADRWRAAVSALRVDADAPLPD